MRIASADAKHLYMRNHYEKYYEYTMPILTMDFVKAVAA